ncbi:MAG: serine protein kinase PrkA, partial [Clostridia bacterium]|nr:serine protein kinase PrkA [Deltaproteobacteria bacterium]
MSQTSSDALLGRLIDEVRTAFREDRTILSFKEYFALVVGNPRQHLRSSAQYLVDMFEHFGKEELDLPTGKATRFKLFDAVFAEGEGRVAGQENIQEQLHRILANFAREGRVNKMVLLHGPNGSAKSSMVRCMMSAMEAYSRVADGAVYSFNWIFPSDRMSGGSIGFGGER